jgi:hypothetical protein
MVRDTKWTRFQTALGRQFETQLAQAIQSLESTPIEMRAARVAAALARARMCGWEEGQGFGPRDWQEDALNALRGIPC